MTKMTAIAIIITIIVIAVVSVVVILIVTSSAIIIFVITASVASFAFPNVCSAPYGTSTGVAACAAADENARGNEKESERR